MGLKESTFWQVAHAIPNTRAQSQFTPGWQGILQPGSLDGHLLPGRGCSFLPGCSHGEWRAWLRGRGGAWGQLQRACSALDPMLEKGEFQGQWGKMTSPKSPGLCGWHFPDPLTKCYPSLSGFSLASTPPNPNNPDLPPPALLHLGSLTFGSTT